MWQFDVQARAPRVSADEIKWQEAKIRGYATHTYEANGQQQQERLRMPFWNTIYALAPFMIESQMEQYTEISEEDYQREKSEGTGEEAEKEQTEKEKEPQEAEKEQTETEKEPPEAEEQPEEYEDDDGEEEEEEEEAPDEEYVPPLPKRSTSTSDSMLGVMVCCCMVYYAYRCS